MGFVQFVALIAAMMATNSFSVDIMLPALPNIGDALGVAEDNQRQWIIFIFVFGFGWAQLIYGPLSDRFGRKPVLMTGLVIYTIFTIVAANAKTFDTLVVARALQGTGAAAMRVLAVSIVRDCYSGRTMARVMSLAFIVFLLAPIIAPTIGQTIIYFLPWPWIFMLLAAFGSIVTVWTLWKLPETLHPEDRLPLSPARLLGAFKTTLTTRRAVGYMLAAMLVMGGLFGFINSAQQVITDALGAGRFFAAVFAVVGAAMGAASFVNSQIVEKVGMRRVSHVALCGFIGFSIVQLAVSLAGLESVWTFVALQAAIMFCFGLLGPNFNAMAMEPLGHIAGTASAVQGFFTVAGGAVIGFAIGQQFNGTVAPLAAGFVICGLLAMAVVAITERGKLFGS